MDRRTFLLSTGCVGAVSGCLGDSTDAPTEDDRPETDDVDSAPVDRSAQTDGATASDSDPRIESVTATDVNRGDETQRITLRLLDVAPGDAVVVHLDVTSLSEANVGMSGLGATADVTFDGRGWVVTDADLATDDRTVLRVTIAVDSEEPVDEQASVEVQLVDLDTVDIDHTNDLTHYATLTQSDPDVERGETTSYDVIDPDELENVLGASPDDLRIGETEQHIQMRVTHATEEFDAGIDITPLAATGVNLADAEVAIDAAVGERRDGLGSVDVTSARVEDGIVRLRIETDSVNLGIELTITGLVTDDAEPTDGLTYQLFTGDSPTNGEESSSFSIGGAVA